MGELVHNKQVVYSLEENGIEFIESIDEITDKNSKLIVRAHGIPKETYELIKTKSVELLDLTCPNVLNVHKIVEEYSNNGFYIVLVGKKKHPETIGTISFCGENSYIIENEEDVENALDNFKTTGINKLLLISQTTFSLKKFDEFKEKIENSINSDIEFVVKNTICNATEIRQKETEQLSKEVDMMIIVGGKNSSNTRKII